jgi:hypothetical protein
MARIVGFGSFPCRNGSILNVRLNRKSNMRNHWTVAEKILLCQSSLDHHDIPSIVPQYVSLKVTLPQIVTCTSGAITSPNSLNLQYSSTLESFASYMHNSRD